MKKLAAALVVFLSMVLTSNGQSTGKLIKYGDEALLKGDHYTAMIYFEKALNNDTTRLDIAYKYANTLRLNNEYVKAEKHYQVIFKKDKGKEFPEAQFWLAMVQKQNGKYEQARENFRKANSKFKRDKKSYLFLKSQKEIESTGFAMELIKEDSADIIITNAVAINSKQADLGAFKLNDSTLYYSSMMDSVPHEIRIYKSLNELTGGEIIDTTTFNVAGFNNANAVISPNGERLYFSRCKQLCEIYESRLVDNKWTLPVKLPAQINYTGFTATQPYISKFRNNEILFFVSDRPGGIGKLDIWYTIVSNNNSIITYATPQPLSNKINSIDNEVTPFYDATSQTLYFSSDWHNGLGGLDIFKTTGTPEDFSAPENLKYPYNTSANDLYYTINPDNKSGFLTSNRIGSLVREGETCCNDIYFYKYNLPPDSVVADTAPTVINTLDELMKYLPLRLYFHNDEPDAKTTDTLTKKNYLKTYRDYIALIEQYKKEYSAGLPEDEAEEARIDIESFFEDHVIKGYNNLEKFTTLLKEALLNGFEVELTIKGYASTLAKSDYNVHLTKRRISSLKNYLNEYEDGFFIPYINDSTKHASLSFNEIPFGEYKSDTLVSDNLYDLKNSVYSRKAARERKIEILAVTVKDSIRATVDNTVERFAEIKLSESAFDFGEVKYGEKLKHEFTFKNTGNDSLIIYNASGDCGCTIPEWPKKPIAPGEEAKINVTFDTKGKMGPQQNKVTLVTNAGRHVLTIKSNVVLKR